MQVDFCRNCSALVSVSFSYCPYCGFALESGPNQEQIFEAVDRIESFVCTDKIKKINDMLLKLDMIETETELFQAK